MAFSAGNQAALKAAQDIIKRGQDIGDQSVVDAGMQAQGKILADEGVTYQPGSGVPISQLDAEDNSAYLKQRAASRLEAELAGLRSAYRKSNAQYDADAKKLPDIYQQAKNAAAAQNAQEKRAFDERAAAGGLNSGANAQAQLAMSGAYQAQLGALDREQAGKQSDIQLAKTKLQADYESAFAKAQAQGNADLADALYKEMLRVQELQREDKQQQDKWDREDALLAKRDADAETQYARELALKHELIDPANIGQIKTLTDLARLSSGTVALAGDPGGTPPSDPGGRGGYNNGNLTSEQVKALQRHFGVATDGMWGPGSTAAAGGKTADEAWAEYVNRPEGVPLGALSSSLISGKGEEAIIQQAKLFVETYPTVAWNSRTVDYMLADSGLTAAERALFKEYLKQYAPTWGTNAN